MNRAQCSAFEGTRRIASGDLAEVANKVKALLDALPTISVLVFDDATGEQIDLDLHGSLADVGKRFAPELPGAEQAPRGPGRPKLGVVPREVTLLPRHWEWLGRQPGGASVALRKLVEEASRYSDDKDRLRHGKEAAYRFMSAIAGNLPGFEEAARALFAGDRVRFDTVIDAWPGDVREHTGRFAERAFDAAVSA